MFSKIRLACEARRSAMLEAEALVWRFGARGVAMARAQSNNQSLSDDRRRHFQRVARIAQRRHALMRSLDTATRYHEEALWRSRRGSMIRTGLSLIETSAS